MIKKRLLTEALEEVKQEMLEEKKEEFKIVAKKLLLQITEAKKSLKLLEKTYENLVSEMSDYE